MQSIHTVYVLYNPNSTGPARQNAFELKESLSVVNSINCELLETKHEKHAIELAKEHAREGVMLISSSGDGGFHELINGVMQANAAASTTVGLLPSGNANDHYTARHSGELLERIQRHDTNMMDVLKVTWATTTVYAHSYAGLGITASIGESLTANRPNAIEEVVIVARGLIKPHPVKIIINGRTRRYDSYVMNLIGRMSKYLSTGEKDRQNDGTFDVMAKRHTSVSGLLRHLFRHLVRADITDANSKSTMTFATTRSTQIQLDGEVYDIPGQATVTVACIPNAIHCII